MAKKHPINVFAKEAAAFRTEDSTKLLEALKAIKAPIHDEVQAELIAIAYVHSEAGVRKKAMTLVKKYVEDAAAFKTAYKTLSNVKYQADPRVGAFEHRLQKSIARAMVFHGGCGLGVAFELDADVRKLMLELMVKAAKRAKQDFLILDQIHTSDRQFNNINFRDLPESFGKEIGALRKLHPFVGLRFHAAGVPSLPSSFAKCAPWLKTLKLNFSDMTTFPTAILKCTNLEELYIIGSHLDDLPDLRALKKLKKLDIGNGKKMKTIPESVLDLEGLEWLRIGNGSINKVPDGIARMTSLKSFHMQSTNVRKLPESMKTMKNLKEIRTRWSNISEDSVKKAIGSHTKIR